MRDVVKYTARMSRAASWAEYVELERQAQDAATRAQHFADEVKEMEQNPTLRRKVRRLTPAEQAAEFERRRKRSDEFWREDGRTMAAAAAVLRMAREAGIPPPPRP